MKISIFGPSPYLHTSKSRIIRGLCEGLRSKNELSLICWDHDSTYFMPCEKGKHWYEGIYLKPVIRDNSKDVRNIYNFIKDFKPDVVISVGDYFEVDEISNIKSSFPSLFKWVSILTLRSYPIEPSYKDLLDNIDYAFISNYQGYCSFKNIVNVDCEYINPGHVFFNDSEITSNDTFQVVGVLKNTKTSNIGSFVSVISLLSQTDMKFNAYLYTNIDDAGYYDIRRLLQDYNVEDILKIPHKFTSFNHGRSDNFIKSLYKESTIIFDPSLCSSTGMSVLEAMSFGCIPVVAKTSAFSDICNDFVKSVDFIGDRHHIMKIIDNENAANKIYSLYKLWEDNNIFDIVTNKTKKIKGFSNIMFVTRIIDVCDSVVVDSRPILSVKNL